MTELEDAYDNMVEKSALNETYFESADTTNNDANDSVDPTFEPFDDQYEQSDVGISEEEGEEGGEDEEEDRGASSICDSPPRPPHQNFFAPPYYGRPPTPLPPSPSLTSLLRASRPGTPDASDDEIEPVPRASPRVPTYEYYGFVLYLFSSLTFLIYLLWAYLPAPFLHELGITYYPDRWWALAVPAFLVMALVYTYIALATYNTEIMTPPVNNVETIVDDAAQIAVADARGRLDDGDRKTSEKYRPRDEPENFSLWSVWSEGTNAVLDIPLGAVSEILYGD